MYKQRKDYGSGGATSKSKIDRYIAEDQETDHPKFNLLEWWLFNALIFSILLELARDVLAILISSVALKCTYRIDGCILDRFISSLNSRCV